MHLLSPLCTLSAPPLCIFLSIEEPTIPGANIFSLSITTTILFLGGGQKGFSKTVFYNRLGTKVTVNRGLYRGGLPARLGKSK